MDMTDILGFVTGTEFLIGVAIPIVLSFLRKSFNGIISMLIHYLEERLGSVTKNRQLIAGLDTRLSLLEKKEEFLYELVIALAKWGSEMTDVQGHKSKFREEFYRALENINKELRK